MTLKRLVLHASVEIPEAFKYQYSLSDAALLREAETSADLSTDVLAEAAFPNAIIVKADVSRIVIEVERFDDDAIGMRNARTAAPSRTWVRLAVLFQVAPPWMIWLRKTYCRSNNLLSTCAVSFD